MMKNKLRIALIAGTLGQGGAEKQLVYLARVLNEIGADVRVYSLTHGEFYEANLKKLKIPVIWIGQRANIPMRLVELTISIMKFRPQFIQSCHFYTNLYTVIVARLVGAMDVGAVRSNGRYELEGSGIWGMWLLHGPRWILTNSYNAKEMLIGAKRVDHVFTLPNVIDVKWFDKQCKTPLDKTISRGKRFTLVTVCRLVPVKRVDRLLKALALIRSSVPNMRTFIVGDGPERENLEKFAHELGLTNEALCFLGRRNDIPWILSQCDVFILTSDDEGFPNVLLEAMAASLPVITTPAGDCSRVVQDGATGYIVGFDDLECMAERLLSLAASATLREELGEAGRRRVETYYNIDGLTEKMLDIYRQISQQSHMNKVLTDFLPR